MISAAPGLSFMEKQTWKALLELKARYGKFATKLKAGRSRNFPRFDHVGGIRREDPFRTGCICGWKSPLRGHIFQAIDDLVEHYKAMGTLVAGDAMTKSERNALYTRNRKRKVAMKKEARPK